MEINLGDTVRDTVTQYQGIVVGITHWLGEPPRISIAGVDQQSGLPTEVHFTKARLELIQAGGGIGG